MSIKVTINLVVLNGQKYINHCFDGILAQTYPRELLEVNILDNGSIDGTKEILKSLDFMRGKLTIVESKVNLGMWPGQEELLKYSSGKYVLAMAVDVILDKDFISRAVQEIEKDTKIGALEAKIYKYDLTNGEVKKTNIIDTCGFKIFRSRRLINIGHGEKDIGQYDNLRDLFGVEGAAPFFRREAIEDTRINGRFVDKDFFWYADDLDIAWRMTMLGWRQVFAPAVIAWHDRQTTKKLRKNLRDFIEIRRSIPIRKRQLEWRNLRFTTLKNDYIINILRDLPHILKRKTMMFLYFLIFEPRIFLELPKFLMLVPVMLKQRGEIMRRARISPSEIHKFFI